MSSSILTPILGCIVIVTRKPVTIKSYQFFNILNNIKLIIIIIGTYILKVFLSVFSVETLEQ